MTKADLRARGISVDLIAGYLGLSRSTVDRHLSGFGKIASKTAEKIESALAELASGEINLRPITTATYVIVDTGLRRGQGIEVIAKEALRNVEDIRKIAKDLIKKNGRDRYKHRPTQAPRIPQPIPKIGEKVKGVYRISRKWESRISHKKKKYHLYKGKDFEMAVRLRREAEERLERGELDEWFERLKL